jgi:hypothetical protein
METVEKRNRNVKHVEGKFAGYCKSNEGKEKYKQDNYQPMLSCVPTQFPKYFACIISFEYCSHLLRQG